MTLSKANAYRCVAALSCRACPLRHCFAMTPLPKGEALAFRIVSCIFLAKFMIYLFCGLARPFYWEGGEHHESIFISYPVRRSKHNFTLCLQVA